MPAFFLSWYRYGGFDVSYLPSLVHPLLEGGHAYTGRDACSNDVLDALAPFLTNTRGWQQCPKLGLFARPIRRFGIAIECR